MSFNLFDIQERDPDENRLISFEQLADVYRIYKVRFCYNCISHHTYKSFITKVGFDEDAANSITDASGFINKENFMRFAKDTKLVDFGDRKNESPKKEKEWVTTQTSSKAVVRMLASWYK